MIVCDGIGNMPYFIEFFQALGMPLVAIWDGDGKSSDQDLNRKILGLLGTRVEFGANGKCSDCHVKDNCVCFACDACLYFKQYVDSWDGGMTRQRQIGSKNQLQVMKTYTADQKSVPHSSDVRPRYAITSSRYLVCLKCRDTAVRISTMVG